MMSGVTPQSTTAGLAAGVAKESEKAQGKTGSSDLPGSFPETPAAESSEFSVKPIPATSGIGNPVDLAPGEKVPDPSTLTSNTISSTVHDDSSLPKATQGSEQSFGVAPIPATSGIGNPVQLKPGEKVPDPSSFTNNTINTAVRLDKESYENGSAAPQLPNVVTPQQEREGRGFGMFGLPDISKNMIPESSLPIGGNTAMEKDLSPMIQSAGPQTSTAQLAGQVPLESHGVPDIVRESRKEAGFAPEANQNEEAVMEKSMAEKELESKVPEEPPTSEGVAKATGDDEKKGLTGGQTAGIAAGGVGALAAGAAALGLSSKGNAPGGTAAIPHRGIPQSVQDSINRINQSSGTAIAPDVPDVVQESITKAHVSPEAAASEEMVQEKNAVENELLSIANGGKGTKGTSMAPEVPEVVQESITKAHVSPEAATSEEMVLEKSAMEHQLLKQVKPEESAGVPAPTASSALSDSAPAPTSQAKSTETPLAAVGSKSTASPSSEPSTSAAPPATKSTEQPLSGPSTTTTTAPASKSTEEPLPSTSTKDTKAGLAAPATAPATTQASKSMLDSRDVSPMSKGPTTATQTQPSVTTGVGSSATPTTSTPTKKAATPSQASPMSAKTGESSASASASGDTKKGKRVSGFFGKLRSKFSDKDKK